MLEKTLRKLRENSRYTQQQVANVLNIDRSTYAYYETGKTTPDINTIIKLAKIFNVSYADILEFEDDSCKTKVADKSSERVLNFRKNNDYIYELTNKEQQVIMAYRVLSAEKQDLVLDKITGMTRDICRKKDK